MIFKDTHRFSLVALGKDLPWKYDLFHINPTMIPKNKDLRKEFIKKNNIKIDRDWWRKQYDRCINGYTVENAIDKGGSSYVDGEDCFWYEDNCSVPIYDTIFKNRAVHISGRMYFYLNFWPIYGLLPGQEIKGLMKPKFLDMDYFFFQRIEMMFKQKKDGQDLKARQQGYSEKVAGGQLAWNYTFIPNSVNIVVGGEQSDADHTMENCERGLDYLINTQFYLHRPPGGNSSSYLQSENTLSEIRSMTAKDKPQSVSRYSPFWVVHEEVGKGKAGWSLAVSDFIKPSQSAEGIKTGYQFYLGTGGDMLAGALDLEERHYNPDKHNILSFPEIFSEIKQSELRVGHFTPKWLFVKIDKDGNSLKQESIEWINKEIEAQNDAKKRYRLITQYAIFDHNVFMIETGGYFGKEAALLLNARKNYMRSHPHENIIQIGRLEWKDKNNKSKGVKWVPDQYGWLKIIEHPCMNTEKGEQGIQELLYANLYEGACDSYDQDEAHTSDSKGCQAIRKGFVPHHAIYNTFVALILERPTVAEGGAELFYEHTAMTCIYYGCQNNIEYSNLRIFDWYKNNGLTHLLKQRPKLAFAGKIKESNVSNPYGTDKSLKPHILAIQRDRMTEDYINRQYFPEIIDAWIKYKYDPSGKKYNCDITIATSLCEVSAKEGEHYIVIKKDEINSKRQKSLVYVKGLNGHMIPQFI